MRSLVLAAFALFVISVHGAPEARATADGPDYYAVTGIAADDVLNIRAAPSARAARIGRIPHDGRGLRNLGCLGGPTFAQWEKMSEAERERAARQRWCRVRYQGVEGWVAGWFLTEDPGAPPEPRGNAQ
jgi:uncharacterized protein YraI